MISEVFTLRVLWLCDKRFCGFNSTVLVWWKACILFFSFDAFFPETSFQKSICFNLIWLTEPFADFSSSPSWNIQENLIRIKIIPYWIAIHVFRFQFTVTVNSLDSGKRSHSEQGWQTKAVQVAMKEIEIIIFIQNVSHTSLKIRTIYYAHGPGSWPSGQQLHDWFAD